MHAPAAKSELKISYRADIDGLRAIAVLSVLAFHYGLPLPGGFTGVDVFFVISGFLITQQLYSDMERGEFSILAFYDRRFKRIVPALVVVLAASLIVGRFLLVPGDFQAFAGSAGAAAFGVSNFFFLFNTDYFAQASELMPLLHTWSLAVEEQFYLIWPLVLLFLATLTSKTNIAAIVGTVVIIGIGVSFVWLDTDPKAAFYMALPRAWELAIGAVLVFLPALPRALSGPSMISGMALIGAGFLAAKANHFPGPVALLPCVGAALVIWPKSKETTAAVTLGKLRPIGKISYSLYLWHWPVLVFFRIYINNKQPSALEATALLAISVALAIFTYYVVEEPLRRRKWAPTIPAKIGLASSLFIFCWSMAVHSDDGIPSRLAPEAYPMRSLAAMWEWKCPQYEQFSQLNGSYCSFGSDWSTAKTKALVWGDSHAGHLAPLVQIAAPPGEGLLLYTNCPSAFGGHVRRHIPEVPNYEEYCADQRRRAIKLLQDDPSINLVILSSSWAYLADLASQDGQLGPLNGVQLLESGIDDLIKQISIPGRRFLLIGSFPQQKRDPIPCAIGNSSFLRRPCSVENDNVKWMQNFTIPTDKMLQDIALRHPNVRALIPRDALCDAAECKTYLGGEFLYRDASHIRRNLTAETLRDLADVIGLRSALNSQVSSAVPE